MPVRHISGHQLTRRGLLKGAGVLTAGALLPPVTAASRATAAPHDAAVLATGLHLP